MPEISMTTFVDFVLASGTQRLTVVKKAKGEYEHDYSPARDFYKALRESIIDLHQQGKPVAGLGSVLNTLKDKRKIDSYAACISSYKGWCGRKRMDWLEGIKAHWAHGDLIVRVNPELCLRVNDVPYAIKLYFKSDKPSKSRLETMFHLLQISVPNKHQERTQGILDVRRGNLFSPNKEIRGIQTLLEGEASAFQTMWTQL